MWQSGGWLVVAALPAASARSALPLVPSRALALHNRRPPRTRTTSWRWRWPPRSPWTSCCTHGCVSAPPAAAAASAVPHTALPADCYCPPAKPKNPGGGGHLIPLHRKEVEGGGAALQRGGAGRGGGGAAQTGAGQAVASTVPQGLCQSPALPCRPCRRPCPRPCGLDRCSTPMRSTLSWRASCWPPRWRGARRTGAPCKKRWRTPRRQGTPH